MAVVRQQTLEDVTGSNRLGAAKRVERDVLRSLETPFRIPRRLAVADVIDGRQGGQSLESEISGASGRFMPTTW
jgi:hypothetical protein